MTSPLPVTITELYFQMKVSVLMHWVLPLVTFKYQYRRPISDMHGCSSNLISSTMQSPTQKAGTGTS